MMSDLLQGCYMSYFFGCYYSSLDNVPISIVITIITLEKLLVKKIISTTTNHAAD